MSGTYLGQRLLVELLKRDVLNAIAPSLPSEKEPLCPFEPIEPLGWFETFLKHSLDTIDATSTKWKAIAAVYNHVMERRNFSNYVIGMLLKEPLNDIRLDTFAWILRHNRAQEEFLLEDLELCPVGDLWLHIANSVPNIPLWIAILGQYKMYEKITGNLFLGLSTEDAAVDYLQQYYADHPGIDGITGATCENEFVKATYNFKKLLGAA